MRTCQFVGNAERTHARPCTERATHSIRVNGLSPLDVCDEHDAVMEGMWLDTADSYSCTILDPIVIGWGASGRGTWND